MLHKPQYAAGYVGRYQKTYLSREITRALATEYPIGDPHGGPAYGERNDPVTAIISIGTMISAGTTIAATGLTLMSGLAFAGAALSLVGNITGNKTLSKIGMVAGLAGGIGALAENIGGFTIGPNFGDPLGFGWGAEAASAAGAAAPLAQTPAAVPDAGSVGDTVNALGDAASGADLAALNMPPATVGTPLVDGSAPLAGGGSDLAQGLSGAAAPSDALGSSMAMANSPVAAPSAPGLITGAAAPLDPAAAANAASGLQPIAAPATTPEMLATANASTDPMGSFLAQKGVAMDPAYAASIRPMTGMESTWQGAKDLGSGAMRWIKDNPEAAKLLGQAGQGASDWLSGVSDAKINALEANGQLSKAQADKLRYEVDLDKQRKAQLNQNYSNVNAPFQINPNAVTVTQPGLVAAQMSRP
jgi:hypothetical protein